VPPDVAAGSAGRGDDDSGLRCLEGQRTFAEKRPPEFTGQ
jgi:hypothetical protein